MLRLATEARPRPDRPPARSPARSRSPRDSVLRLQRSAGNRAVVRLISRKATADCPGYDPGEVERSRTGAGILSHDVMARGPGAMLIADFGVDRSDVKPETKSDADLQAWIAQFERDRSYRLSILGLDDCVGATAEREKLRKERATNVRDLFGPDTKGRIAVAEAAPADEYTAPNDDPGGRAKNRGALVLFDKQIDFKPERRAKPEPRPTVDCDQSQIDQLAEAFPIAQQMVDQAIESIRGPDSTDPLVMALLRKYFTDDGVSTHTHVRAGFLSIRNGLKTDFTFECEEENWMCDGVTYAYVIPGGWRVHMCKYAFGKGTQDLASTIVHESSHKFDFTGDKDSCNGPRCPNRWVAYDNADSYAEFAKEVFRTISQ